jgi:hypothetical protein
MEGDFMVRRPLRLRAALLAALGTALLLTGALVAAPLEQRFRLSNQALERSRGSNQGNGLAATPCNTLNKNYGCSQDTLGLDCVSCVVVSYNAVVGAGNSYATGGTVSCGNNMSGTCVQSGATYVCDTYNGDVVGVCQSPPQTMLQAH